MYDDSCVVYVQGADGYTLHEWHLRPRAGLDLSKELKRAQARYGWRVCVSFCDFETFRDVVYADYKERARDDAETERKASEAARKRRKP